MTGSPTPPPPAEQERLKAVRKVHGWAVKIIQQHFSRGLDGLCTTPFLRRRYQEFKDKGDPVYSVLVDGMQDEELARTFVSYWTVGQTLATQSRFWLENAITEIVITKARAEGRNSTRVYSQALLARGYLDMGKTVEDMGERWREELTSRRPWRVSLQRSARQTIDQMVGEHEGKLRQLPFERVAAGEEVEWFDPDDDMKILQKVADALTGPPPSRINLQCSLLVIEPDRLDDQPHVWGIRYVNPKTLATHANRKQERVNLLRLYAYLVQEKLFRDPRQMRVCVADLLPRTPSDFGDDRTPDYFSSYTHWPPARLWEFIGVPYDVVTLAISDVAIEFQDKLRKALASLLPGAEGSQMSLGSTGDTRS